MSGWNESDVLDLVELDVQHARIVAGLRAQVAHLREQGCPWSVIAEALGMSKQGAQQRYGKTPRI